VNEEPTAVGAFGDARARVLGRIAEAAARAGRDPGEVTLVAVSKTVPVDRLRIAVAAGLDVLGENRVQEGVAKAPALPGARWHLVGPLQANKARRALETFDVIQTVGSVELAERLDRIAAELGRSAYPVLLQVNVDRDSAKAGFAPESLDAALASLEPASLEIRGLMTVGRGVERASDARRTFAALRESSERLRERYPRLGTDLSMGMSDDYAEAVEEGATIVRVGRALFGERPHVHRADDDHGATRG
jgi:pyridoxal phosphate enzyme (YggS family)